MTSDIINPQYFDKEGKLALPDGMPASDWAEIHRTLMDCKRAAKQWVKDSRTYAEKRYGLELVAEVEVQYELNLGIEPPKEEQPKLNPPGKASVFVSIEGIAQQFQMWERKMDDEIQTWDRPKLSRALDYLAPIERKAQLIRELMEQKTHP